MDYTKVEMYRELFTIPGTGITVYTYGLLLVIGAAAGIWLCKGLARRKGLDPELFVTAGLLALLFGVAGARLSHVLENWSHYTRPGVGVLQLIGEALNIRQGGLTYYGGFLLAFPALVIYAIIKKVNVRVGMDIIAPALMIGLAFGRIGCLANGCCYGQEWNSPLAIHYPYDSEVYVGQVQEGKIHPPRDLLTEMPGGEVRLMTTKEVAADPKLKELAAKEHSLGVHPTQIYSSLTGFLIAALLLAFRPFSKVPGHGFALMLMIEPITRFLIELLRVEPPVEFIRQFGLSMSLSMALAIPQFFLGLGLWFLFNAMRQRDEALLAKTAAPKAQSAS